MKPTKKFGVLTCGAILSGLMLTPLTAPAQIPAMPAPATATPVAATDAAFTPAAPAAGAPTPGAMAPLSPTMPAAATDAGRVALEPVRQAIAARDFAAAQQALEQARQANPGDPAIAVYENLIRNGMSQGQTEPRSVIRTPIPGVTPLPVVSTPTPTPEVTPAPVDAADSATDSSAGASGKINQLLENDLVRYGVFGLIGLMILFILFSIFRKRKNKTVESDPYEEVTPIPGTLPSVGGAADFSDTIDPLATPAATDFSSTDFSSFDAPPAQSDASFGGNATSTDAPEFMSFGLDDEEHVEAPKPAFNPRPAPTIDDDMPLSLHDDDEPTAILPSAPTPTSTPSLSSDDDVSFESMGLTSTGASHPTPAAGVSSPTPASGTPTSTPGTVNLDDIFGNQAVPGSTPATDDRNSETLPTFVSTPDNDNPEDNVELPRQGVRPPPPSDEKDLSISFEELFGGSSTTGAPAPTAARAPEPAAPAEPVADQSIEDALAATLGAMQEQDPNAAPPAAADAPAPALAATPTGTESLDERTERMFHDQMEKARTAMADKNWRQAVHVLSIASALHPEHEEAKQMLREARAEKRKSEESV